jgi:hypothetical protein
MKTAMLDDTEPAVFDMNAMNIPGLAEASSAAVWNEWMVIGVRNDHGDVYRVIGVSSLSDLHYLIGKLRNLGVGVIALFHPAMRVGLDNIMERSHGCI